MKRKILTILLALVMTLITIPVSVFAEADITDGQLLTIPFEKNADMIVSPTNDVAEINPDTWMGGLVDSYGSAIFSNGFGGFAKGHIPAKDGKIVFSEKVYDTVSGKLIGNFEGSKTYEIPYGELSENENNVLDSYIFTTVAPYQKTEASSSLNIKLEASSSTSISST